MDPLALSDSTCQLKKSEELTVQQVAKQFGVSDGVVYYWIEHNVIPSTDGSTLECPVGLHSLQRTSENWAIGCAIQAEFIRIP